MAESELDLSSCLADSAVTYFVRKFNAWCPAQFEPDDPAMYAALDEFVQFGMMKMRYDAQGAEILKGMMRQGMTIEALMLMAPPRWRIHLAHLHNEGGNPKYKRSDGLQQWAVDLDQFPNRRKEGKLLMAGGLAPSMAGALAIAVMDAWDQDGATRYADGSFTR